jgi:hypothetical protein
MGKVRKNKPSLKECKRCNALSIEKTLLQHKLDETFKQCLDQARLLRLLDTCDPDGKQDHSVSISQMEREVFDLEEQVRQLKSELYVTKQKLSTSAGMMEQMDGDNVRLTKEMEVLRQHYVEDVEMFIRACERAWEVRSVELTPAEAQTLGELKSILKKHAI